MDNLNPNDVYVHYFDSKGNRHYQTIASIADLGTLIDPFTDDDMEMSSVTIGNPYEWTFDQKNAL